MEPSRFQRVEDELADLLAEYSLEQSFVAVDRILENLGSDGELDHTISKLKDQLVLRRDRVSLLEYADHAADLIAKSLSNTNETQPGELKLSASRDQLLLLINLIPVPVELTRTCTTRPPVGRKRGRPAPSCTPRFPKSPI